MSRSSKSLPLDMSRQQSLADFFRSSSAASSSKEREDELTSNAGGVNEIDPVPEDDEESSELETESDGGDLTTSDSLPAPKRRRAGKHRKSGFDPKWTREFKWLEKVEIDGRLGMQCKLCKKHGKVPRNGRGSWCTEPCFTMRKDKIMRHAESHMHRSAAVVEAEHGAGGIRQAFQDAVTLEVKAAIGCCKCIYFLCKQEIAHTTTYPHLLTLAESLGCEYFKALNVGRNAKYTSPQIVAEFLDIISGLVEEDVLENVKASSFYSLMVDESTNISILKQLVLYGRCVVNGELKTRFLKIVDLADGKAPTIVDAITTYLTSVDLGIDTMSSFGSDGASVMTGRHAGVATLLRSKNVQMIAVHCICHRLALASAQASNEIKYLKQMKDHLFALWNYFHHSSVRMAGLKQIQQVMNSPELKMVKAVDTRWLSNKAAVSALLRCLPAVLVTLQQQSDPTAVGLLKVMTRYNFLASLLLLDEVLSAVSRLSLAFQRATIDLTVISPLLSSTVGTLEKIEREPAASFQSKVNQLITKTMKDVAELRQSNDRDEDDSDSECELIDTLIQVRANEPERFESSTRQKFLSQVITNLEERFPQVDVLEAFSILDPAGLLGQEGVAEEKLEVLLEHYHEDGPMGMNLSDCVDEYNEFSTFVKKHSKLKSCKTLQELAREVLGTESLTDLFPSCSKLMVHALVLPMSTSDCERCFSTMKRVKTDLRNRMNTQTLDRLLRVRLEAPEDQSKFDFKEAVYRWGRAKNRRLF